MRRWILLCWILLLGALAACQPQAPELPTLVSLDAVSTDTAATAQMLGATETVVSVTQTAVATLNRPTALPPTWTVAPPPTQPPTAAVSERPTDVPLAVPGTIFYVFNGDSIAALKADMSDERLIHVGDAPAELTLSPDGKFLAFTAQGSGSAREVFITSLDGSYNQQVSCLGFARVTAPAWSPDSLTLAFAGSQTPDGPLGIYAAGVIGSGQCPEGNNQRLLGQTDQVQMSDMTWNNDGSQLFITAGDLFAYDVAKNLFLPPQVNATGYGPNYSVAYRPNSNALFFLKTVYDRNLGKNGGVVFQTDTTRLGDEPLQPQRGISLGAEQIRWSTDGKLLLVTTSQDIYVQRIDINSASQVLKGGNFFPQPVFSPDGEWIAYVDGGADVITVPQIYLVDRKGENRKQISFHKEGTITDLNWYAG